MADHFELLSVVDAIVARAATGEQVEAVAVHERETEVRAFEGEVESLTAAEGAGVGVRVIRDDRQGFAYAGSLDQDVIDDVLGEARDNASFGTPDEYLALAEPDGVEVASLDLYRDSLTMVPTDEKVGLAVELERLTVGADPRMTGVESADYVDVEASAALASTAGVRASSRETACYVMVFALAEAAGETQTGFGWSIGRDPADLDIADAATDAARRATQMLGATKPGSERLTVVLDPYVTAQLVSIVGATLSGESVLKGRSLFADRVGEQVAAPGVALTDDPTDPAAFSATETDGEGLATRSNLLIDDGLLQGFVHNSYTARRLDTRSTGSAVRGYASTPGVGCMALSLRPGERTRDDIIGGTSDGFLVQGVAGLHSGVNPVSGDFSTGAEGLRIRNGEIAEPIREVTIASTIQRMLLDIVEIGSDLEWMPGTTAGVTIAVDDVTMSGA